LLSIVPFFRREKIARNEENLRHLLDGFSEANMLYLESPAGVGFSYSTDPSFYGGVGDSRTGEFYICICQIMAQFCAELDLTFLRGF
jgi:hypothetical protein